MGELIITTNSVKGIVVYRYFDNLVVHKKLFQDNELELIDDLMRTFDYDNYLIAKAIVDNRNG